MQPPPPSAQVDGAAPGETHRFPCPACGSDLRYRPGHDSLVCAHCGAQREIPAAAPWSEAKALAELDFETARRGALGDSQMEETRVAHCDSCGAEVEFDAAIHARECPFCAAPLVADTGLHRHIKPRALLPFRLDEEAARKAMIDWLGRLWFAPNGVQRHARKGRRLSGLYVPCWTFDADTRTTYRGQRGDDYWTTERRMEDGKMKTVRVQKTRWTAVSGRVARDFDDVLAPATRSLPPEHADALEPWDLSALTPYRPDYLAGFRAEAYQIPLDDGYGIAREKMDAIIRRDVLRDIGGDRQRISALDTAVADVTFKHVLLPVWMAAYRYRGRAYRFVVNARTGAVAGERPWSAPKIAAAVLAALILAGAAFWLMSRGS